MMLLNNEMNSISYRQEIRPSDPEAVLQIVRSSGFFSSAEVEVAHELVCDGLANAQSSSYRFLFAQYRKVVVGYTCYGLIPATAGSYDLYWIAVTDQMRGRGLGKNLLQKTENLIRGVEGRRLYAETSSRDLYLPTRLFYEKSHYLREAVLVDFYAPGDSKIIYSKFLNDK
ncbi:MAG: GNAT family N-acetyltransferase [Smithellaceae bacterium]|jgi:N-acetylglutamate synthase-like GNAT family acetyltransferase|nr:GNAT family N-acetyltransferase [Syntrophaceae bacterium]